jgi:hypothetical protein
LGVGKGVRKPEPGQGQVFLGIVGSQAHGTLLLEKRYPLFVAGYEPTYTFNLSITFRAHYKGVMGEKRLVLKALGC